MTEIALCWEFESLVARELVDSMALKKASLFTNLVTEIVSFRMPEPVTRTDLKVHRSKKFPVHKTCDRDCPFPCGSGRVPRAEPGAWAKNRAVHKTCDRDCGNLPFQG